MIRRIISIIKMCLEPKKESKDESSEMQSGKYSAEIIKQLQMEINNLKLEIEKMKKVKTVPYEKLGLAFIISGASALFFSILNNSNILAFIGLSLTFWGALLFFIRPIRYVQSNLLDSTAISTYKTIDRIVKDLKFKEKSYYIPPYPKDAYLPEHLKSLKDPVIFISANQRNMPSIDDLAKGKFLLKNPNGICITPPGLGLLKQFEIELRKNIEKLQLTELCETLPQLIVENLSLAREAEIKIENNQIYIKLLNPAYKNLYMTEDLKSIHFIGCPLTSAIACAIAKASKKTVTIQKEEASTDGQTIEVWYDIIEDQI